MDPFLVNNQSDAGGTLIALAVGMAGAMLVLCVGLVAFGLWLVFQALSALAWVCARLYSFASRSGKHVGL